MQTIAKVANCHKALATKRYCIPPNNATCKLVSPSHLSLSHARSFVFSFSVRRNLPAGVPKGSLLPTAYCAFTTAKIRDSSILANTFQKGVRRDVNNPVQLTSKLFFAILRLRPFETSTITCCPARAIHCGRGRDGPGRSPNAPFHRK